MGNFREGFREISSDALEGAKAHKKITVAGFATASILLFSGVMVVCNDELDPSGVKAKREERQKDLFEEKDAGRIPLEDGINAILLPSV